MNDWDARIDAEGSGFKTEPIGRSLSERLRAPLTSTSLDRWALSRIQGTVRSAPIGFALWDGFELRALGHPPVATIVFKNRQALFGWVWDPELNFGEAYMSGGVEIRGDLVALLEAIYRAWGTTKRRPWWLWQQSNDVHCRERERSPPLRSRQQLLPALARSGDGLHVRVFPDAGRHARSRPDREDGPRLPQAAAPAGRARGRGGMRMGLAGALHGAALRRDRSSVQCVGRTDRLRAASSRRTRGSPIASSSSRTTTATSAGHTTRSCRSACSSTSAPPTIRRWAA